MLMEGEDYELNVDICNGLKTVVEVLMECNNWFNYSINNRGDINDKIKKHIFMLSRRKT
jgi:hypothetical protein